VRVVAREYALLRALERHRLPAVKAVGHARVRVERDEADETGILITRFLDASLPFRTLFMNPGLERYRARLMDAMAGLLVRLHLSGFYWGDCSLSNTLFRRDAGELQAFLVDAETAVEGGILTDAQRKQDLHIMEENLAGEIADLRTTVPFHAEVPATGATIDARYRALWAEITHEESIAPGETYRIHERIRALNALGFSVGSVELIPTGEGDHLRLRTVVTDRDYHRRRLHSLSGVVASERQAALLLGEIQELRAMMARDLGRTVTMNVAAHRWLHDRYQPVVTRLAEAAGAAGEPAESYCQVLEHKWYLSERKHHDVGLARALEDYIARVLHRGGSA